MSEQFPPSLPFALVNVECALAQLRLGDNERAAELAREALTEVLRASERFRAGLTPIIFALSDVAEGDIGAALGLSHARTLLKRIVPASHQVLRAEGPE